jgi:hypothetical protein
MDATIVLALLALVLYGSAVGFFCYTPRLRWTRKGPKWMNARQLRRRSLKEMGLSCTAEELEVEV